MIKMKWTKEQEEAIYLKGSNIIVSAGAGSGKTAVLTERTIETLKSGVKIEEMIILTFTKAAAFSMKEKIKKRLRKENDPHLKEQLKTIEQASICTFDSFSLDLVKKYSDVLNIDPDISIADSVVIESMKNEIIDEVFLEFYEDERFLKLLDTYTVKDDKSIKSDVTSIIKNLDKIYDINSFLDNYLEEHFNEEKIESDVNEYIALIDNKYQELSDKIATLNSLCMNEKEEKVVDALNNLLSVRSYADYTCFNIPFPRYISKEESVFKVVLAETKELFNEIKDLITYESIEEMKEEILSTKPFIEVIIDLSKTIITRINKYKEEHNLYEFNDISRLAIKLLEENKDICDYYKNHIKEIMIDEYQDTNDIGDYFISLIANNNVFMVGDVKQSIYRFRNANPQIFIEKYNNYSNHIGGAKIDLNKNFRSRREVINNINTLFSKIMDEYIGGADYEKDHLMIFGQEAYLNGEQDNNLEILNYNPKDYYGFKREEIEAFAIAYDIKNKYINHYQICDLETNSFRNMEYSDCSILLSQKSEFELYKKIFDYLEIPLVIHKDEDLTYASELIVIKNIIKLVGYYKGINLDNALNKTFMSVARSFILNISDKEIFKILLKSKNSNLFNNLDGELKEKIVHLSSFSDNHSISELVTEVINVFDFYLKLSAIGDQKLISVKLDHLINIALSLEKQDYHLEEFIKYLTDASNENIGFTISSEKDTSLGVNLMTIHKSKGLEFPICYFADLNKKFSTRDIKARFLFDMKYGFIAPIFKEGIKTTIYKYLLKEAFLKEEISERIRVFYVALTRAKEKMIFVTDLTEEEAEETTLLPKNIRMKYRSLKDILNSIKNSFPNNIKALSKIDISRDYEKIKLKTTESNNINYDTIEINIEKEIVEEKHFSHSSINLMDNELLTFGTKIHEYLEYIDFNNFLESLNSLDIDDYFKNKLLNLTKMPFIKKDAIYRKEYEFIYNDLNEEKHGIIDLLIETNDELIVVDYKLENIDKPYYVDQVRGYMNYLKTVSEKQINGYLYSILDEKYTKIEE